MTPDQQQRCREALLPCPFCGGEPRKCGTSVECKSCGARVWLIEEVSGDSVSYTTGETLWNTRAYHAQEERMKGLVEGLWSIVEALEANAKALKAGCDDTGHRTYNARALGVRDAIAFITRYDHEALAAFNATQPEEK